MFFPKPDDKKLIGFTVWTPDTKFELDEKDGLLSEALLAPCVLSVYLVLPC
jgi:hypothetical protein